MKEKLDARLEIRLTTQEKKYFILACEKDQIKMSEVLRKLVVRYIKRNIK